MPELDNVVVVSFDDDSKPYQALSVLKYLSDQGRLAVKSAAVVQRDSTGATHIADGFDAETGEATAGGSLTGMLVGVLGGPLGTLLGASTGALVGGTFDLQRASGSDQVLSQVNASLQPGKTVLVAEVTEYTVEVLDGEMGRLGGTVTRRPSGEVIAELEAAEDAAEAAQAAASKALHEQKKAERKEKLEERKAALKDRRTRHRAS
jgi:uncharacterized membrane protein